LEELKMRKAIGLSILLFAMVFPAFSQEITNWEFNWTIYKEEKFSIVITKTDETLYAALDGDMATARILPEDAKKLGQTLIEVDAILTKMVADGVEVSKKIPVFKDSYLTVSYTPTYGKA
jgi:hypothetical protein